MRGRRRVSGSPRLNQVPRLCPRRRAEEAGRALFHVQWLGVAGVLERLDRSFGPVERVGEHNCPNRGSVSDMEPGELNASAVVFEISGTGSSHSSGGQHMRDTLGVAAEDVNTWV